ncbi:hypothetical protein D3C81_1023580 [compost metagenome]
MQFPFRSFGHDGELQQRIEGIIVVMEIPLIPHAVLQHAASQLVVQAERPAQAAVHHWLVPQHDTQHGNRRRNQHRMIVNLPFLMGNQEFGAGPEQPFPDRLAVRGLQFLLDPAIRIAKIHDPVGLVERLREQLARSVVRNIAMNPEPAILAGILKQIVPYPAGHLIIATDSAVHSRLPHPFADADVRQRHPGPVVRIAGPTGAAGRAAMHTGD